MSDAKRMSGLDIRILSSELPLSPDEGEIVPSPEGFQEASSQCAALSIKDPLFFPEVFFFFLICGETGPSAAARQSQPCGYPTNLIFIPDFTPLSH